MNISWWLYNAFFSQKVAHSQSLFPLTEKRERNELTYAWDLCMSWDTELSVLQASHTLGELGWIGYPRVKVHKHIDFPCGKIMGTTSRVDHCFYFTPMSYAKAAKWYSKSFSCYKYIYIQTHERFFLSSYFFSWRTLWVFFWNKFLFTVLTLFYH